MDAYEYTELIKSLTSKIKNISSIIKPDEIKQKLSNIQTKEEEPEFWNDPDNAAKIQKEKTTLTKLQNSFNKAKNAVQDADELYQMAVSEDDPEAIEDLFIESDELLNLITELEINIILSNPEDSCNAIISIHPGAGGTESNDWADMLYRMYLRWAESQNFKVEELDYQSGDEAGIKDVSFIIKGENAYGLLKVENGIHRLVRISPFDSNAKRHTSFASVMVSPEIDDTIEIEIEDKDIRIDTYRASGAGGQHVNKTDSAIRITHIETNIVVQCQNDRSQHKNKAAAMKMLKSRLYELELEKQQAAKDGISKDKIGWGHQIRSYVLAPYKQVKDNRSNQAYSNVEAILDGDLNQVIKDTLVAKLK